MKKLTFALFMAITFFANAQARINFKLSDIITEFAEYDPEYDITSTGLLRMTVDVSDREIVFYFNKMNVCVLTAIIPNTDVDAGILIKKYNENYYIVDNFNWRNYRKDGVLNCEFVMIGSKAVFMWTEYFEQ